MKISEALQKRKPGQEISSSSAKVYNQTPETLLYWLLEHNDTKTNKRDLLYSILGACDWKIEAPDCEE